MIDGRKAGGVAFMELDLHGRKEVVEGVKEEDVLHRVLYPQVHVNGVIKKQKNSVIESVVARCDYGLSP